MITTNGTLPNQIAAFDADKVRQEKQKAVKDAVDKFPKATKTKPEPATPETKPEQSSAMAELLRVRQIIANNKASKIEFQKPVIVRGENADGVIMPRTINVIQAKTARFKSTLMQILASAVLKKQGHKPQNDHLGFQLSDLAQGKAALLYCDTERNIFDQFPAALQSIQKHAGYEYNEELENFDYISLLSIAREARLPVFVEYLEQTRKKHKEAGRHLFVVLDVITDLILSFNDVKESMQVVDLLNSSINHHDITFFAVIHENPSGDNSKARGHLGTELSNKASTVIGLDFVKDVQEVETDVVCVRFLKCRATKRHEPFYARYSDDYGTLEITEKPQYAENKETQKRDNVKAVFKGLRMTKAGFARDYAAMRGLKPESSAGFNVFSDSIKAAWIVPANEKTEKGEALFWFVDDAPNEPEQQEMQ
jgi:hypothetical protein